MLRRTDAFPLVLAACLCTGFVCTGPAARAQDSASVQDLDELSIEQLANLEVISTARRPEPLSQTPAAAFVITADDIRRSGATSIPEVLRLAPNLEVARIDSATYTITARGFNSTESANKLLVLIDGRSVYSPLASTVFWESLNVDLADVERIEVTSGPGGTLWGANAVNGVINIITKSARDTLGAMADLAGGSDDRTGTLRYGGTLGDNAAFRIYAMGFNRGGEPRVGAADTTKDGFDGMQGGFRVDAGANTDSYTVQGDIYGNHIFSDPGEAVTGGNLQAHWTRQLESGSSFQLLAYFDQTDHDLTGAHDSLKTYDIQGQETLSLGTRHQIVWGGEYRLWQETLESTGAFFFAEPKAVLDLGNLFAQDEIALSETLKLILGLKIEDNNFSGFDYLPNLRLAWQWNGRDLIWGAVSRSVRTPSRIDRQLTATGILDPSPDFSSEKLVAYELGYRGQFTETFSFSASTFFNVYDDLRTDELTNGGLPIVLGNGLTGNTYGAELWGNYAIFGWWRLSAGFNWLHKDFHLKPGHTDFSIFQSLGEDPAYQAQLRSQMNLAHGIEADVTLHDTGKVSRVGIAGAVVPGYIEADARLGWRVSERVELSLEGFNLLHARHLEVNDPSNALPRYISRAVLFAVRTHF